MRIVRTLRRARVHQADQDGPLGGDSHPSSLRWNSSSRPDATDVGIAGSPALSRLRDLETRVDSSFRHAPSVTGGSDRQDAQLGCGVIGLDELDLDPGASRQAARRREETASFGHMNGDARRITVCDDVDGCAKRAELSADLGRFCLVGSIHVSTVAPVAKRRRLSSLTIRSRSAQVSSDASSSASWTRYPTPGSATISRRRTPSVSTAASFRRMAAT
jgi:hypothetical protein